MKRRKVSSSESTEKRLKPTDTDYVTPKKSSQPRSRFVTPFKMPIILPGPKDDKGYKIGSPDCDKETPFSSVSKSSALSTPKSKQFRTPVSQKFQTPVRSTTCDAPQISPMNNFLKKRQLQKELDEKKSLLRKFKLYKNAKDSGEIDKIKELIVKWRTVGQETINILYQRSKGNETSLTRKTVLDSFSIDPKLLNFNEEDDDFDE